MISQKSLKKIRIDDHIIYQGAEYNWYSGVVLFKIALNGKISGLGVVPTDSRLSTHVRKIWDSSGNIYELDKQVLLGQESPDVVRTKLTAVTPKRSQFKVGIVMEQLDDIISNYRPVDSNYRPVK
ncbi:hypothetical protein HYU07_01900 [Candidatus Woesearchaeota archaeon]|nr:hypothetical protein [Candidatus Woesearchaeota archaeon]